MRLSKQTGAFRQRDGLKIRQSILQKIKTQVQMYLGDEPKAIRSYALAYKKDIERSRWQKSSQEEMHKALLSADVVFAGDFHAFAQAQRVHLRILRQLVPAKKIILAMECIPSKYQKVLDRFMLGQISEDEFLKKVQWGKNWGFPWSQYKPLFDLMRERGGRCLALNQIMPQRSLKALQSRDKHAVQILAQAYLDKSDDECLFVIYGDLHIAQTKLPGLFKKAVKAKAKPRVITIYLNPEKIYFRLFKKNKEHAVNVVQFSKNEFCLLESPPWVKWQSYLLFLEESLDQALDDERVVDYSEHVHSLLKLMSADLKRDVNEEATVYSFNDHDFLDILSEKMSRGDMSFVQKFVQNDIAFFEPHRKIAFLPRSTVNYAAHLAGHILHSQWSQRKKFIFTGPMEFTAIIWAEAMAFFLSKLVNPHRKSINLNDLKKQLAAFSPGDGGERALKIALDQKMRDLVLVYGGSVADSALVVRKNEDPINYYKAAKILGAMMGERVHAIYKTGRLSRLNLMQWLEQSLEDQNFQNFYVQVLRELDTIEVGGSG